MPKHKTTYMAWREYPSVGGADVFGVIAWDIEAWNADHALRIVREQEAEHKLGKGESIAVVPARYFRQD